MKKTKFFMVALTLVAISVITGCKKEDNKEAKIDKVATATHNIVDKTWKMTAWTSKPAWNGVTDVFAVTSTCYKDNTMYFSANGVTVGDEGATLCNPTDLQTKKGTWVFTNDGTRLRVNELDYKVMVNNGTVLKLSLETTDKTVTPNVDLVWTLTFNKQ